MSEARGGSDPLGDWTGDFGKLRHAQKVRVLGGFGVGGL